MRGPTAYETYTRRLEDYYKIKHLECPSWIRKAAGYYNFLYYSKEVFGDMCSCTHIPKSTMVKKWVGTIVGYPVFAAILSWVYSMILL